MLATNLFLSVLLTTHIKLSTSTEFDSDEQNDEAECGVAYNLGGLMLDDFRRHDHPWKAAIFNRQSGQPKFLCGGALISRNTVLTAAHCLHKSLSSALLPRDVTVVLGAHNFEDPLEHGRISSGVRKVKIHPDWDPSEPSRENDLAILELVDDIQFNRMIRPVCLPNEVHQNIVGSSDNLIAAGWGTTNYVKYSKSPLKVGFFPVDSAKCFENIRKRSKNNSTDTSSKHICAKVEGRGGTCGIDDGTGIYEVENGKFFIKGIMSFELDQNCTKNNFIAVTDIAQNMDFVARESGLRTKLPTAGDVTVMCSNHSYAYCCTIDDLVISSANFEVTNLRQNHEYGKSNWDVQFIHFHVKHAEYLVNFRDGLIASTFPNLVSYVVEGYEGGDPRNTNNHIDLKKNLKRSNFKGLPMITRVGINYCNVKLLPEDLFYDLLNLENVNLHHNQIEDLPSKLLINNPKLNVFSAQNNAIEVIPRDFFDKNPKLWYVQLDNNRIRKIGVNFKNFNKLDVVTLTGNVCVNREFHISKSGRNVLDELKTKCNK